MKSGLTIGDSKSLTITVTSDMFAAFNEVVIHPLFSTVSLVYHMEWISRMILEPFLEKHEEGMGVEVKVKHLNPANEGSVVVLHATVNEITERSIFTIIEAQSEGRVIAEGSVKQAIVAKEKIEKMY